MSTRTCNYFNEEPPKHLTFKIGVNLRNLWINHQSGGPIAQDNYLANYVDDQKQKDANEVIWVCTAMSIFGIFVFGLAFQIASLMLLASCLFRRRKPTRGGKLTGTIVGVWNLVMISMSLFWILG